MQQRMYPVYGLQPPASSIEPPATTLPPTVSRFQRRSFVLAGGWLAGGLPTQENSSENLENLKNLEKY